MHIKRIRVLLISPIEADIQSARRLLEDTAGYEVVTTPTLEKAASLLTREPADAVLLRLDLPDSSGLNTLHLLKEKIPGIPIVILADAEDPGLGARVIQSGAQDILVNFGQEPSRPVQAVDHAILRKRLEEKTYYLATHDQVSGLPNRVQFFDRLQHALARAERIRYSGGDYSLAVLMLDLDQFQRINESFGEPVGSLVIAKVAKDLRALLRKSDTIASLGGDRFALLLEGVTASTGCATVAEKILETFSRPLKIDGFQIELAASIGISRFPNNGNDIVTLFKMADSALQKARQKTKSYEISGERNLPAAL